MKYIPGCFSISNHKAAPPFWGEVSGKVSTNKMSQFLLLWFLPNNWIILLTTTELVK